MTVLRSVLFNTLACAWTVFLALVYMPLYFAPRRVLHAAVRWWIHTLFFLQRGLLRLDFEFRGREHLPAGGYIIASAHQSAWDTIAFYALLEDPSFVLKKELYRVPLFGAYAHKCGMIAIDRSGGVGAVRQMLRAVGERLAERRPVIIFPGGTRSRPDEVVALKSGINALYRHCGVPVVPVSLNSGVYWGRRSFVKKPGTIVAEFGPPILPGLSADAFDERLSRVIHDGNRRLVAEARKALGEAG